MCYLDYTIEINTTGYVCVFSETRFNRDIVFRDAVLTSKVIKIANLTLERNLGSDEIYEDPQKSIFPYQITLTIPVGEKERSIKVFQTGQMQFSGCSTIEEVNYIIETVIDFMSPWTIRLEPLQIKPSNTNVKVTLTDYIINIRKLFKRLHLDNDGACIPWYNCTCQEEISAGIGLRKFGVYYVIYRTGNIGIVGNYDIHDIDMYVKKIIEFLEPYAYCFTKTTQVY